ncbi:hypothetical protein CIT26_03385 [Mesorhizobium temperatum]|uniref:Uncharacterized protein n=2 Tax=Mesorhizobium temperatum TaxID=241416 RepID=A0A271LWL0_9HYPH|nr:hypothetical protein CIT26_03385 [Mesorhizobium temperatum]
MLSGKKHEEAYRMAGRLFSKDHKLLEQFIGVTLDRFKVGAITKDGAIGQIAHVVTAVSLPEEEGADDWRAYMKAVIADKDA